MTLNADRSYFAYWGKAQPKGPGHERYHLLAYHCLDVAACGQELLRTSRFGVTECSHELGWDPVLLETLCVTALALHDIGKFSGAFQALAGDLGPALVPGDRSQRCTYRHDTLGWMAATELLPRLPGYNPRDPWAEFLRVFATIFAGHHGKPPLESEGLGRPLVRVRNCFRSEDMAAAGEYAKDVLRMFLPEPLPSLEQTGIATLRRHSWRLAGFAVLADWLGSNSESFPYCTEPMPLRVYWEERALPAAREVVAAAGLHAHPVRSLTDAGQILPHLRELTPLQRYAAAEMQLTEGPQFFLLEDVTGAGKTEAALLLCHRLMAAGKADGFYFALPTMATANQMYRRVGPVYRAMFAPDTSPSLVLAHGARDVVDAFRNSVLYELPGHDETDDVPAASAQCAAWLADSRKKALLADVGVGTVDQVLLGVLPVRHQSLRLLGLAGKVLVVDEVHAYDDYTGRLLHTLVEAQAQQGGSVVLLSATVPATLRASLVEAFQKGCGTAPAVAESDERYPLVTHADRSSVRGAACSTRAEIARQVSVRMLQTERDAEEKVLQWAREGRAVCWIRNTVDDARRSFTRLQAHLDADSLTLFHSRFVLGDRLRIEDSVLTRFGSGSTAHVRRGQVLIATQVVEQSLDLDFDEMVTDLAPVDLLIQRAGRLHRHIRDAAGSPSDTNGRSVATLHVLAPAFTSDPSPDWYSALFPKGAHVYEDHGKLWRTLRALTHAGEIVTPGATGQRGSVRALVESVYGVGACPVPEGLAKASQKAEGKQRSDDSFAHMNALKLTMGYCITSGDWDAADKTPTRLGDETRPVYLAIEQDGALVPMIRKGRYAWENSFVRVDEFRMDGIAPGWLARFRDSIHTLQGSVPLLSEEAGGILLPMIADGDGWMGWCQKEGRPLQVRYETTLGLLHS